MNCSVPVPEAVAAVDEPLPLITAAERAYACAAARRTIPRLKVSILISKIQSINNYVLPRASLSNSRWVTGFYARGGYIDARAT